MPRHLVNVRVRPPRAVVLVSSMGGPTELSHAIELLSGIWGGRYFPMLPANPECCDPLTRFRLSQIAPDLVYGIGLDHAHWQQAVDEACQPRLYIPMSAEPNKLPPPLRDLHTSVGLPLLDMWEADRSNPNGRRLMLVEPPAAEPFASLVRASFGSHPPNLREDLRDGVLDERPESGAALADAATSFIHQWDRSWLDVTGYRLGQNFLWSGVRAPTIVLADDIVTDLALFWNLRAMTSADAPPSVLVLPLADATDEPTLAAVARWLNTRHELMDHFSYCEVTSQSVGRDICLGVAGRLKAALTGGSVLAVDYRPPPNRIPFVEPVERELVWQVERRRRHLSFLLPTPDAFGGAANHRSWIVDLRQETGTGRAVMNAVYPSRTLVTELLNAAAPPMLPGAYSVRRFGNGERGINVWGSRTDQVVHLHAPSGHELAEEVLREIGLTPVADEKRKLYLPAFKRFGGAMATAKAFTGTSRQVLLAMKDGAKTVKEIKGICKLGKGTISGKTDVEEVGDYLDQLPERVRRVSRQRWAAYAHRHSPGDLKLATMLEFWSDRGVLARRWRVGPCGRCGKQSFLAHLRIDRPIRCPVCGDRLTLRESVELAYDLHPAIRLAIQEGLMPVALTTRFLSRLTHRGFLWTPGVKYTEGTDAGDVDLVACCDGTMVFCECKDLPEVGANAEVWASVEAQLIRTAKIAIRCGRSIVVLASRTQTYPASLQEAVIRAIPSVRLLMLNAADLESGQRELSGFPSRTRMWLDDLLPDEAPEPERIRPKDGIDRTGSPMW